MTEFESQRAHCFLLFFGMLERRVRDLEVWQSVKTGEDMRSHGISAGVGAGAGGLVAVLVKLLGGDGLG